VNQITKPARLTMGLLSLFVLLSSCARPAAEPERDAPASGGKSAQIVDPAPLDTGLAGQVEPPIASDIAAPPQTDGLADDPMDDVADDRMDDVTDDLADDPMDDLADEPTEDLADDPLDDLADEPMESDEPGDADADDDAWEGWDEAEDDSDPDRPTPDVHFVPTPQAVVDRMLELAKVTQDDVVYDLGCGDGRIVVTAAKRYGCKAIGVDIDPRRVEESKANVSENGVDHLVTIEPGDIFERDLRPASVVTLYLLPDLNVRLIPQLKQLNPGSRIVSHAFSMRGVKPDLVESVDSEDGTSHTIYLWTTPLTFEETEADDWYDFEN
jgi:SAM-dependent methyltransferase